MKYRSTLAIITTLSIAMLAATIVVSFEGQQVQAAKYPLECIAIRENMDSLVTLVTNLAISIT